MKEIVLTDEGAFVRIIETRPIADEMLLKNYFEAEEKLVFTPKVLDAGNHLWDLYTKNGAVFACTQLKRIVVNAKWEMTEDGGVLFSRNASNPSVQAAMELDLSANSDIWFACIWDKALYVAVYREGQIYRPPLPNFFDTGKMCMGENHSSLTSLHACVGHFMDIFNNASYNTDLWTSPCRDFLKGKLNPETGVLEHTPDAYTLTEVVGGRIAEIYEHAIKRIR